MTLTGDLTRPLATAAALTCLMLGAVGCASRPTDASTSPAADRTTPASPSGPASAPHTPSSAPDTPSSAPDAPTSAPDAPTSAPGTPMSPTETLLTPQPATAEPPGGGGAGRSLRELLLPAAELPGFNERFRWRTATTRSREPHTPVTTCQRFPMTSVGATRVAVRTYRPAVPSGAHGPDHAREVVAELPDSATARRAFAVLTSWRGRCAERLRRYSRVEVGDLREVGVSGGSGRWYLLTYGPVPGDRESRYFDAQGMAVVGARIAMVQMVLAGQDYGYAPGREPVVAAVRRAAARLR